MVIVNAIPRSNVTGDSSNKTKTFRVSSVANHQNKTITTIDQIYNTTDNNYTILFPNYSKANSIDTF